MTDAPRRMLTFTQLREIIPLSRSTIWRMRNDKTFPQCVRIRGRALWFADEIAEWQKAAGFSVVTAPGFKTGTPSAQ